MRIRQKLNNFYRVAFIVHDVEETAFVVSKKNKERFCVNFRMHYAQMRFSDLFDRQNAHIPLFLWSEEISEL